MGDNLTGKMGDHFNRKTGKWVTFSIFLKGGGLTDPPPPLATGLYRRVFIFRRARVIYVKFVLKLNWMLEHVQLE